MHIPRTPLLYVPSVLARLHAFARGSGGGAAIELALGTMMLVSTAVLCIDLYSRVKADTAVARMAVTMADYVSRDSNPDGDEMKALGGYLHEHELGVPADLVYVVTALHQPPGDPRPVVLWSDDTIQVGDAVVTTRLAADCAHFVADGGIAGLPAHFTMADDEVLIVTEVCASLTREGFLTGTFIGNDIYRLHALPARVPGRRPAAPVYAKGDGGHVTVAADPARTGAVAGVSGPSAPSSATARRV